MTHDIFTMYSVKAVEYLIAVAYLVLFIPFWRFLNAEPVVEPATAEAPGWIGQMVEWFRVPEHLFYHPGHAWARVAGGDLVTVGIDDFAQKLVGQVEHAALPPIGARVSQGERGWTLGSDSKSIDMLSPVDGTVVAVNERVLAQPEILGHDPYGDGWLMKVRAPRVKANVNQLLSGTLARRWMEEACDGLRTLMSPELGRAYQDGGVPVQGMARSLDPVGWDELARKFLLTSGGRDES